MRNGDQQRAIVIKNTFYSNVIHMKSPYRVSAGIVHRFRRVQGKHQHMNTQDLLLTKGKKMNNVKQDNPRLNLE